MRCSKTLLSAALLAGLHALPGPASPPPATAAPVREVRGTWLTTTANDALATPDHTARTMRRLRDIGINTVYIECWKNGVAHYPSAALRRAAGVPPPARDLLQEAVIEAHRNGLIAIAWFEYGFMAAHGDSMTALRRAKPEWLSRDIRGNDVAPNGFVWMNPLHPEVRRFLLDLVLEAVDRYDLDGVQFDDRLAWPHVTMGYDDFTRRAYAAEHGGRPPPADHRDPAWMRWRAGKVEEFARSLVQEVRARRPSLRLSLSPAVYPWSWEHYLLEWPTWAAWTSARPGEAAPRWDEFVPQAYRIGHAAFARTWREQVAAIGEHGGGRVGGLLAGIRVVGEGRDATWDELRDAIRLARETGSGGHVLWFSRGVLDVHPGPLAAFYGGHVPSPRFPAGWRPPPLPLFRAPSNAATWCHPPVGDTAARLVGRDAAGWREIAPARTIPPPPPLAADAVCFALGPTFRAVERLIDRRRAP